MINDARSGSANPDLFYDSISRKYEVYFLGYRQDNRPVKQPGISLFSLRNRNFIEFKNIERQKVISVFCC